MTRDVGFAVLLSALCILSSRTPAAGVRSRGLQPADGPRAAAASQASGSSEAFHRPLDQILDVNVRDGLVYYRALRGERGRLDRYVASLNVPAATYDAWPREHKMAFWVNAYNAFVLQTVINNYPIHGRSATYPENSIRQIPGAFERGEAPRRRPQRDARRDREDDPPRVQGAAPVPGARPRGGRQRPPAQRSVRRRPPVPAARRHPAGVRVRADACSGSIERRTACP